MTTKILSTHWTHDFRHDDNHFVGQILFSNCPFIYCFRTNVWHIHLQRNIIAVATYVPEALKHPVALTSSPRSADTILPMRLFLSLRSPWVTYWGTGHATFFRVEIFFPGGGCFSNTARKLSKNLVTWTSSMPIILPSLYLSGSLIGKFCLLQKPITQSFPEVFFPLLNLTSVLFLSAYSKANLFMPHNLVSESLQ